MEEDKEEDEEGDKAKEQGEEQVHSKIAGGGAQSNQMKVEEHFLISKSVTTGNGIYPLSNLS